MDVPQGVESIVTDGAVGLSEAQTLAQAHGYPLLADIPAGCHIAVIGTGPAGMYTLRELLARTDAHITVIDELPTPGG